MFYEILYPRFILPEEERISYNGLGTESQPASAGGSSIDAYLKTDGVIDLQYVKALATLVDAGMQEYEKWCTEQEICLGSGKAIKHDCIRFRDLLWGALVVENNRLDVEGKGTNTTISIFDKCRTELIKTRNELKYATRAPVSDIEDSLLKEKLLLIERVVNSCTDNFPKDFPPDKKIRYTSGQVITAKKAVSLMLLSTQEKKKGISVDANLVNECINRLVAYSDALKVASTRLGMLYAQEQKE